VSTLARTCHLIANDQGKASAETGLWTLSKLKVVLLDLGWLMFGYMLVAVWICRMHSIEIDRRGQQETRWRHSWLDMQLTWLVTVLNMEHEVYGL
jgi:hypothetical protein